MTAAFYEALERARKDSASIDPASEMGKLAARMLPGSRIAGITLGARGADLTPEDIAREINKTLDLQESGELKAWPSFAEAERATPNADLYTRLAAPMRVADAAETIYSPEESI